MRGEVISIVPKRGFGFIRAEDLKDYFFHRDDFTGFWQDLQEDVVKGHVSVVFEVVQNPKGLRAANVKREDWPNA